jgi:dienelactone hydrolase
VNYIEREFYLPDPAAMPPGLDVLEVRADVPGRHPLALITHGTGFAEARQTVTPWAFQHQALWFAERGYVVLVVVRRGYGRSGGEQDGRRGGCGRTGSFTEAAESGVEDLQAVARYAAKMPEIDESTIVSAGVSTGGLVQAALAADPMPGLKAAISFAGGRGGDGAGHNCDEGGLVATFRGFGKRNRVPMLWIYAENDKWFPPKMSQRFDEAFRKGGGDEQFVMAPPDGEDGHHLFGHVSKWSPVVEDFMRKHDLLPLGAEVLPPPLAPDIAAPAGLSEPGIAAFRRFLTDAPYKAFVTNGGEVWGLSSGQFDQETADRKAMEQCRSAAKGAGACKITHRGPH